MRTICAALFLGLQCLVGGALASPCLPGTLEDYLLLGSTGCTVDSLLFADFALIDAPTGSEPFRAIQITPSSLNTEHGLRFTPADASAGAGTFLDEVIGYTVTALGAPIVGAHVFLTGPAASGTGAVTAVDNLCLGGLFSPGGPIGCPTAEATLIAVTIDGASFPSDQTPFGPVAFVHAITDIGVDGGPDGTASLVAATSHFFVGALPEPGMAALLLAALAALLPFTALRLHRPARR